MRKLNKGLVLVKVHRPKEKTEDGVFIQEEWQTRPPTGVVKEVADDVKFCKKGDLVFFERFSSIPTPFGDDIRVLREDNIFTVEDAVDYEEREATG